MSDDLSSSARRPSADRLAFYLAEQTDFWAGTLHHCRAVLVDGEVDPGALATACADIQRRHAALRRHFRDVDGEVLLVPGEGVPVELVTGGPRSPETARTVAAADAGRPFDLDGRPAIRVGAYPVEGGGTLVALTVHAAVGGRSAASRLLGELGERYRLAAAGEPPPPGDGRDRDLAAEPRPGGVTRDPAEAPQVIAWPTGRGRGRGDGRSVTAAWSLDAGDTALVRGFADRAGVPLDTVLRCALRVQLFRETGERDILIGSPEHARTGGDAIAPEGIRLHRHALGAHTPAVDAVQAEHAGAARPAGHPDALNALLVRGMRPERRTGVDVQVGFRFDTAGPPAAWAGMTARAVDLPVAHSPYELELDVAVSGDRLAGTWRGAVGLFDEDALERMGRSYTTLLRGLVHRPDGPVGELDVIHPADRARLARWEAPTPAVSGEDTVVELVGRWIRDTPGSPAVVMADAVRTYRDLDEAAGRVAAALRALRLPAEAPVGVLVARRVELPAILLGIARAGLAAVPMDPAHPVERLSYIVGDSGCAQVITDGTLPADRVAALGVPEAPLDDLLAAAPEPATGRSPHADSLAYVLYTSGSTGRPKGVAVTHRGLANCLVATRELLDFRPGRSLLAVTTISFDIAMLETFLAPACGGRTILATTAEARDGARLQAALERYRPDVMQATPMTWRILFETGWPGDPELVVSCGGDVVSPELASRLVACTKEFWHTYGPTEASMYAVCERVPREPQASIVPVGRPLPGVWLRILDATGRPVPPGVVGELHIGGVGVARGYVGMPGQTAERFVPDAAGGGGRIYRTGDLARWRADGRLELRGRNDRQVKIRGHRIEPDEIESVLSGHPDVAFAAVAVVGDDRESRTIVAFLQPREPDAGQELVGRVAAHARQVLPGYMVPSSYALMGAMPLTATGKVDRGALARIRPPRRAGAEHDPEAIWVHEAWRSVSGGDDVELGGDLRLAWKLRAHVRRELDVRLRLGDIVAGSTADGQAQRIRRERLAAGAPPQRWSGRADRSALVLLQGDTAWPAQAVADFGRWFKVAVLDVADGSPQDVLARLAGIDAPGGTVLAAWGELAATAAALAHEMRERVGVRQKVLAVEPPAPDGAHRPEHTPHWVASREPALLRQWRKAAEHADLVLLAPGRDAATDWPTLASVVAGMG